MLYKRGRLWWCRFRLGGTRRAIPTGESNRRRAESKARRLRVDLEQAEGIRRRPGRPSGVSIESLEAIDIARAQDEGLTTRRQTLEWIWRPLKDHFGADRDCRTLTVGEVVEYAGRRRTTGVRGQTVRREIQALVRALRLAKRDRVIAALPFDVDDLPRVRSDPPKASQRGKIWRLEQVQAMLDHLHPLAVRAGHRDRCVLILLTGLRIEEMHRLRPSWVVPVVGGKVGALLSIPAEAAKWGKPRTVPLVPAALEIVERCAPFARLKPNKSLAWACDKAGLEGVITPRDLRTMFLTAAGSADPVAAQWLGGHTNIATTGLYLRSTEDRAVDATLHAADRLGGGTIVAVPGYSRSASKSQKGK